MRCGLAPRAAPLDRGIQRLKEALVTPLTAFTDIEALSLSESSYPVEIGIALPSPFDDGWRIAVRSWLVRPTRAWLEMPGRWDPAAEQLHGLTLERMVAEGLPPAEVAAGLDAQIRGRYRQLVTARDVSGQATVVP